MFKIFQKIIDLFKKSNNKEEQVQLPSEYKPELCFWIDRSWKDIENLEKYIKICSELRVSRVGLFVNGIDHNPFNKPANPFFPFTSQEKLINAVKKFGEKGIKCDLTCWIWPHPQYIEKMVAYVKPVLEIPGTRLDLDSESAWATKYADNGKRVDCAKLLYSLIPPEKISINDYASLQDCTRLLFKEGVRLRPQAYSVGYVVRNGQKVYTTSSSYYWPGTTQRNAMSERMWGKYLKTHQIDIGLACYKPINGLSKLEQIKIQVEVAKKYNSKEIWFWQLNGIDSEYKEAFKKVFPK